MKHFLGSLEVKGLPPMDTLQPFVEAWIVGPTFLNFKSHHRTSSSLAAQEAKSSRVLFQFLSVVALIQGPFRRSDMTDIQSANSVTVPTESPVATSEADILLDLFQSKRSQYKAALPKSVIHARPPSQAHGKSPLLRYIIFPIHIFPSITHFQRQIRTTSILPQECFPVPEM